MLRIVVLASFAVVVGAGAGASTETPPWHDKVHPLVLGQAAEGPVEFVIVLDEQGDLRPVHGLRTRQERGPRVHAILTEVAGRTQAPLIALLEAQGLDYRPYWIANLIWVRGDIDAVATFASRNDVARLDANPRVGFAQPALSSGPLATGSLEWGLTKIMADQVWALGYDGTGVVIGGQDTGYEWTHPALKDKYRGWDGATADHDYNWHDSIHFGGGDCGPNSPEPCDDHNHGTHTMGTMVGDDGGSNQIGVAPGARWIGCRNMDQGNGTPVSYTECFQWFAAPTDLNDQNPDPSKAPHVINNSWSCPPSEGCDPETLRLVVNHVRLAGIVVVVSAGNSGSSCGSVSTPAAIYDASFTVGATSSSDGIASFSSRGPVTVDGSGRLKPDVAAPGVGVRSSIRGGGYASFSGTSMAGPHVVGLVALLFDARPDLIGSVDEAETIVSGSAIPLTSSQDCGAFAGTAVPNAVFGHGRVDALASLVGDVDGDGTDNLGDCAPTDGATWSIPGPATDLLLDHDETDGTTLAWSQPANAGGLSLLYDVVRSALADDFSAVTCLATDIATTGAEETEDPENVFYYLVRSKNPCGDNLGAASAGPRTASDCP